MLEVHVPVRVWRFKSSRPHHQIIYTGNVGTSVATRPRPRSDKSKGQPSSGFNPSMSGHPCGIGQKFPRAGVFTAETTLHNRFRRPTCGSDRQTENNGNIHGPNFNALNQRADDLPLGGPSRSVMPSL